ncbi:MAG TPA: outer membrane beta-barrel protein [Candidatus Baltobacteraceae bacterium]|nr:outer membrane beta-barrel protein [Candidatus Baltobacteraceae bacterium]
MGTRATFLVTAWLALNIVLWPPLATAQQTPPATPTGPSAPPGTVPSTAGPADTNPLTDSSGAVAAPESPPQYLLPPQVRPYLPFESPVPLPLGTLEPARSLYLGPVPSSTAEAPPDFRLQTFVTVSEEFTNNAHQTKNNQLSEWITTIAPGIALDWNRPNTNLNFAYVPRFYFPSNHQQDSNQTDNNLTLRAALRPFDRVQFRLSEDFAQNSNYNSQQNIGSLATQGNTTTNTVNVAGDYSLPWMQASLGYTNSYSTQSVNSQDNTNTNTGQLSVNFTNPTWSSIRGTYAVVRGDYPNLSPLSYWEQDWTTGATYVLSPRINLTADGTAVWHQTDNLATQDFVQGGGRVGATIFLTGGATGGEAPFAPPPAYGSGLAAPVVTPSGTFLTLQAGGQYNAPKQGNSTAIPSFLLAYNQRFSYFNVTASFDSGFQNNYSGTSPTGVSRTRSAGLLVSGTMFRLLTPSAGVRWYWQQYESNTSYGPAGTKVGTFEVDANLTYQALRTLAVVLGYVYTDRTSTFSSNQFMENRVQLSVSFNYDRW